MSFGITRSACSVWRAEETEVLTDLIYCETTRACVRACVYARARVCVCVCVCVMSEGGASGGAPGGGGEGNGGGVQREPLVQLEAVRDWGDLITATRENMLGRRDNRDMLMERRVAEEVRLARARETLFRRRQELERLFPFDSREMLGAHYEQLGRETAVRGELMAAIAASVEATAVENECVYLENLLKTRGE